MPSSRAHSLWQFYVTLGPCDHLSGRHVCFGRLVAGEAALAAAEAVRATCACHAAPHAHAMPTRCFPCANGPMHVPYATCAASRMRHEDMHMPHAHGLEHAHAHAHETCHVRMGLSMHLHIHMHMHMHMHMGSSRCQPGWAMGRRAPPPRPSLSPPPDAGRPLAAAARRGAARRRR